MHADELDIDVQLVHRLVVSQFPHWADLPLAPVPSAGTDNAIYRLGAELVARLPRSPSRVAPLVNERTWLPRLGSLPLAVPVTVAEGDPGEGYPWTWSIYRWLEGDNPTLDSVADLERAAIDLAEFVRALQRLDPTGGPPPGEHNFGRGEPLVRRDDATRTAIASLHDELDVGAVTEAWDAALQAPPWSGSPLSIHGDLSAGNLLVRDGRLAAVIDFGCVGVGDPACDLMIAWTFLVSEARAVFRSALAVDDATWARGRGWALSTALIALPYYVDTNPVMVRGARHTIAEVLADGAV
jgi:aminoglycoside phosphotransferase (APT) family kinase protein